MKNNAGKHMVCTSPSKAQMEISGSIPATRSKNSNRVWLAAT